ncbi:uncharacterized protein BDV14DRAFT_196375 [Aspergillus stella-maris]|uniref:uncharacterized protein n=1 Tax=Aspergillus stella-maris TaxID=1810926 RepID=UPI003CCD32B3
MKSHKPFLTDGAPDTSKCTTPLILEFHSSYGDRPAEAAKHIPDLTVRVTAYLKIIGWENTLTSIIKTAFARLKPLSRTWGFDLPTAEAEIDTDLFVRKYFTRRDISSIADQRKTKKPVRVACRPGLEIKLAAAVSKITGLQIQYVFPYNVSGLGRTGITDGYIDDAGKCTGSTRFWDSPEPEEEDFVDGDNAATQLTLPSLSGSFTAHCEDLYDHTERTSNKFYLQILPPSSPNAPGTLAAFTLGLIKGTMLLELSEEDLDIFEKENTPNEVNKRREYHEDLLGLKRKRIEDVLITNTNTSNTNTSSNLGTVAGTHTHPHPSRIYFRWAGLNMRDGSLEGSISDLRNQGYLDFDKDLNAAVGGWIVSSFVDEGQALEIEIEKVDGTSGPGEREGRATSWGAFRERSDASKRRRA